MVYEYREIAAMSCEMLVLVVYRQKNPNRAVYRCIAKAALAGTKLKKVFWIPSLKRDGDGLRKDLRPPLPRFMRFTCRYGRPDRFGVNAAGSSILPYQASNDDSQSHR
jgi:hypothetical protein